MTNRLASSKLRGKSNFLLTVTLFDLLAVKYGFRPRERLPKCKDEVDVFDLMRVKVSCRLFQNRKLTSSDHNELLEVVQHDNNSANKKIGNNPIRFEYINGRIAVWPVVGAQEFLVAIVPKTYSRQSVIDVGRN